jgi:hypothetical protein
MSNLPTYLRQARGLLAAGLALTCLAGCNKAAQPMAAVKPAAPANTNASGSASNDLASAYVSVFEDLLPPKGQDPFFPKSRRRKPAPTPTLEAVAQAAPAAPVDAILVLKGIVGSANRRLAIINNETLETGETSAVRVPDGRVRLRCLEIGPDYVLIKVEGEDQPKRLELGK